MKTHKKILIAGIGLFFFLTCLFGLIGMQPAFALCNPVTLFLCFLLLMSNVKVLGPFRLSTDFIGLAILTLSIGESMHFCNAYILHTDPYTPLIRFIYILPNLFFAINQILFVKIKLKGLKRELSFVMVNSFCVSALCLLFLYKFFSLAVGSIKDIISFTYLLFMFIAAFVCMMNLQTFFLVERKDRRRGTLITTVSIILYEFFDIIYVYNEAVGKNPDSHLVDISYTLFVIGIAAGLTIQVEKKYIFEFRKPQHTARSIRLLTYLCLAAIIAAFVASRSSLLTVSEGTNVIIIILSYLIMNSLLYSGDLNEKQNEMLERMVEEKTKELTESNAKLIAANEAAETASKAKSTFLANMSHEIRTPINTILGMDEMILREAGDPTLRKYALNIQRAGEALLAQVNDVLDFSRIEAGKMELYPDEFNTGVAFLTTVSIMSSRASAKGLTFISKLNEDIPHILYGDNVRIRQVIINLLTNAVKYTREGSVTFAVDYEKIDEDNIYVDIRVSDTGIGIREEDIERLFSEFERIDENRNRTIEGTGLGMNIVWRLLSMMDSRLNVESEYGKGSTFSFRVKLRVIDWKPVGDLSEIDKKLSADNEHYHTAFTAEDAKVLLVDDTEMNLMVTKGLLKNTLVSIETASDGRQALSMTETKEYDVLLIDHRMPVMDGMEMIRALRAATENPNAKKPCIALTANAVAGAREEYLSAGFDDYLTKPINSVRIENLLLKYLPAEKVTELTPPESPSEEDDETKLNPLLASLEEMNYLNISDGLEYSGDEEMYLMALKMFWDTIDVKSEEIRSLYDAPDWSGYRTKVHALKSTAKIIGAEELSNRARALELAATDEDWDYIVEHTGEVLAFYRSYKTKLAILKK